MKKETDIEDPDDAVMNENGDVDYKNSTYSASFTKKSEAASDFSKFKSLKEQKEFLPIYTVKDELLQVIERNKIIIIVGETGSGKTT